MNMDGNFVLLRAGTLRLLLPQDEVGAAEYAQGAARPAGERGLFEIGEGGQARAVVALSGRMDLLAEFPPDRFVLTRLLGDDCELSFAWDEARVLIDAQLVRHPLPAAMRTPGAPIEGYVERDGEILFCSTAQQVMAAALEAWR